MNENSKKIHTAFIFLIAGMALCGNAYASPCSAYCKQWNADKAGCLASPLALVTNKSKDPEETKKFICNPCKWAMLTKSSFGVGKKNQCYDSGYFGTKSAMTSEEAIAAFPPAAPDPTAEVAAG